MSFYLNKKARSSFVPFFRSDVVFHSKDIDSFKLENADSLLKYDLASSVKERNETHRFFQKWISFHLRDFIQPRSRYASEQYVNLGRYWINRMRDTLDIKIDQWEAKRLPPWNFILWNYLYDFITEYEKLPLKCQKRASSVIDKYLSWIKPVFHSEEKRNIFYLCFNVLFEAEVTDRNVWKKLYSFVNKERFDKNMMADIMISLDPDRLRYFFRHVYSKSGCEVDDLDQIDIEGLVLRGKVNQLKVLLEFKSCVQYNSESEKGCFVLYPIKQFIPKGVVEALTKIYSRRRLALLIQMTNMIDTACQKKALKKDIYEATKLYWKTIPEAFITWMEMKDFLRRLNSYMPSSSYRILKNTAKKICLEYKRFYGADLLQPRSLRNYGRIAAKKLYSTAAAIDEVTYPKELKSYIKFQ